MDEKKLDQLERLARLREQGAITEREYQQQKASLIGQDVAGPRLPIGEKEKVKAKRLDARIRWFAIAFLVAIFALIIYENQKLNLPSQRVDTMEDTTQSYTPTSYTILETDTHTQFKNFEVLVNTATGQMPEVGTFALYFKGIECADLPCNVIGIWDDEKAYHLYKSKSDDPYWRKENWPFVCEHYVADYNATVKELNLYPFVDSEYRRWGGKMQRPDMHSFNL